MAKLDSINPEADKKFEERERKKRGLPKKGEFTKKKKKRKSRRSVVTPINPEADKKFEERVAKERAGIEQASAAVPLKPQASPKPTVTEAVVKQQTSASPVTVATPSTTPLLYQALAGAQRDATIIAERFPIQKQTQRFTEQVSQDVSRKARQVEQDVRRKARTFLFPKKETLVENYRTRDERGIFESIGNLGEGSARFSQVAQEDPELRKDVQIFAGSAVVTAIVGTLTGGSGAAVPAAATLAKGKRIASAYKTASTTKKAATTTQKANKLTQAIKLANPLRPISSIQLGTLAGRAKTIEQLSDEEFEQRLTYAPEFTLAKQAGTRAAKEEASGVAGFFQEATGLPVDFDKKTFIEAAKQKLQERGISDEKTLEQLAEIAYKEAVGEKTGSFVGAAGVEALSEGAVRQSTLVLSKKGADRLRQIKLTGLAGGAEAFGQEFGDLRQEGVPIQSKEGAIRLGISTGGGILTAGSFTALQLSTKGKLRKVVETAANILEPTEAAGDVIDTGVQKSLKPSVFTVDPTITQTRSLKLETRTRSLGSVTVTGSMVPSQKTKPEAIITPLDTVDPTLKVRTVPITGKTDTTQQGRGRPSKTDPITETLTETKPETITETITETTTFPQTFTGTQTQTFTKTFTQTQTFTKPTAQTITNTFTLQTPTFLPSLGGGFGGRGGTKRTGRFTSAYSPSFTSAALGITATKRDPVGELTGLGVRPIIRRKKKKKKTTIRRRR